VTFDHATDAVLASPPAMPAQPAASLAAPWPSPARSSARIAFALARAGETRLELFDASGRRVRTLAAGALAGGRHEFAWDLRDDTRNSVHAGVYMVRLTQDGKSLGTTRVVVVR